MDSCSETFKYNGKSYILKMELVTEAETDSLYSVVKDNSEDVTVSEATPIVCKVNLAHPFFTRFDQFKKGKITRQS